MANNIIGTVGVGAQSTRPDWNQNDPNAKDYIKNRPGGYVIPPSVEIAWDGDVYGKETVNVTSGLTMVKIANEAPPIEKFAAESDTTTFTSQNRPSYAATITADLTDSDDNTETKQLETGLEARDGFWIGGEETRIVMGVLADHAIVNGVAFSKGVWVSVYKEVK